MKSRVSTFKAQQTHTPNSAAYLLERALEGASRSRRRRRGMDNVRLNPPEGARLSDGSTAESDVDDPNASIRGVLRDAWRCSDIDAICAVFGSMFLVVIFITMWVILARSSDIFPAL